MMWKSRSVYARLAGCTVSVKGTTAATATATIATTSAPSATTAFTVD